MSRNKAFVLGCLVGLGVCFVFGTALSEAEARTQMQQKESGGNPPSFGAGTPIITKSERSAKVDGRSTSIRSVVKEETGYFLPDGNGGLILYPGEKRPEENSKYMDARELKLQVRELAEQLLADIKQGELYGKIAMPTTFVDQENFNRTSAFGRYIAEQMFHEFNQRGFPVREYRIGSSIRMMEGHGDFFLNRSGGAVPVSAANSVVLVGTYYQDCNTLFINARLIRPSDGYVFRTGQMVIPINSTTRTMLAKSTRYLEMGTIPIKSRSSAQGIKVKKAQRKSSKRTSAASSPRSTASAYSGGGVDLSVLDEGYDIH